MCAYTHIHVQSFFSLVQVCTADVVTGNESMKLVYSMCTLHVCQLSVFVFPLYIHRC